MLDDAGTLYFSTYYDEGAKADDQGDPFNSGLVGVRIAVLLSPRWKDGKVVDKVKVEPLEGWE